MAGLFRKVLFTYFPYQQSNVQQLLSSFIHFILNKFLKLLLILETSYMQLKIKKQHFFALLRQKFISWVKVEL